MLTIIIIVLVVIILFLVCVSYAESEALQKFLITLIAIVLVAGFMIVLFIPVSGYNDWQPIKRIELVSLSNSTVGGSKGFVYVSVSSENVYTYRCEIDSEFGTETSSEYKTATVKGSDVIEVEDPKIVTPYLQVYERTGKKSLWTFALATEYKYVFYVPVGTISREVKLD